MQSVDGTHYRVSGGQAQHVVDLAGPTCDCGDFTHRGVYRVPPSCKHLRAVADFRAADPQGPMLDALSEQDTLDVIDPPVRSAGGEPDPDAVAVADAALATWRRELRDRKRTARTFDALWVAACATMWAREAQGTPHLAARWYALAQAVIERETAA